MRYVFFVFLIGICSVVFSQSGITIYSGLTYATSPDKIMTPEGTAHLGYTVGITARLNEDPMYFMFTGEYGAFNLAADQRISFVKNKDLSYTKGKFGLGFDLAKLGKKTTLRSKLQGNILMIYKVDQEIVPNDAPPTNKYIQLNEAIGGISTGIGLTYGMLDLDIEYEHGIYNIYYQKQKSTVNFFNFTAGIRF
jgi:hypothetical protein